MPTLYNQLLSVQERWRKGEKTNRNGYRRIQYPTTEDQSGYNFIYVNSYDIIYMG
jgi:hypothetical protein